MLRYELEDSLSFLLERAPRDNVSPRFSGTVYCPGTRWHERAHQLMASMGLSRLDVLSLSTDHCLHRLLLKFRFRQSGHFIATVEVFSCCQYLWVGSRDAKANPVDHRRDRIKLSDAAVGRSLRSIRDYRQCANLVRERTLLVDPVPARVSMASPAPMKCIPFPLLRKSNRYLACGTPFLSYAEFCRHTLGASVYGAFEEAQTASTWHFSPERHEV